MLLLCYYSWLDCLVGSTQGCPCPCFLQIIRRLKQACFLIRLKKKNPSNFHPWKRSMEISPVVRLSCCPSEPPRGLAEIPDVRMFSEQLVKFDPKQSRAKKKKGPREVWAQSSRISCPKRAGPAPCQASQFQHWESCGQPHKASGFGGSSLWPLNLPSLPKAVPCGTKHTSQPWLPCYSDFKSALRCKAWSRGWLMDRSVGP